MDELRITGFTLMTREVSTSGNKLLARFDCRIGAVELRNCGLLLTAAGGIAVKPPYDRSEGSRPLVTIADDKTRHQLQKSATQIYRSMGGEGLPRWADKSADVADVGTGGPDGAQLAGILPGAPDGPE